MIDRVVSSEAENLILVNSNDEIIGELDKGQCHDGIGVLHRAFSVFLFDQDNHLLIQKRSDNKRLWPGYWANSCCSHPRVGETMEQATQRRLVEEVGVSCPLTYAYKFEYHAQFGDIGAEHELCYVYLGRVLPTKVDVNPTEVAKVAWVSLDELDQWLSDDAQNHSGRVAPWFRLEWQRFRGEAGSLLDQFLEAA